MAKRTVPSRAITPPKNRPTRSRTGSHGPQRVFGPTAQWIVITLAIGVAIVLLAMATGSGAPLYGG